MDEVTKMKNKAKEYLDNADLYLILKYKISPRPHFIHMIFE